MDGPSRLERDTMLWRLKSYGYRVRLSWVQILDLPLISYVTLNDNSGSQFPYFHDMDNDNNICNY